MLSSSGPRRWLVGATLAAAVFVARAQDDDSGDGLRRLQQETVGVGDQFLGQLSRDEKMLVFVSNQNTVTEVYAQEADDGRPKLLFDEGADVTWPRVSPDGTQLLYISFRDQAPGQLCLRTLPAGEARRCLDDPGSAMQAEWLDNTRIALLSRRSIEGDLHVLEVGTRGALRSRELIARSLSGLAVSPDGRWLAYLPLQRYVTQVGPGFAARAGPTLELMRADGKSPPMPLGFDLPGVTGQPAFSPDGKGLYFAQFLNDTNQDGVIDAGDHGVLFRVAFPSSADDAPLQASRAEPQQLTDASWNCQYPNPAKKELLATCTRRENLAVYSLPLEGRVPPDWSTERLAAEVEASPRAVDRQLLLRHLLGRTPPGGPRRDVMLSLIQLHLRLGQIDSAEFYARRLAEAKDRSTAGLGTGLRIFLAHRRAVHDRERGRMSADFVEESEKRLAELIPKESWAPSARAFAHVVRSEIADELGEKGKAREELEQVRLAEVALPSILAAYAERAEALYRSLDDRPALVQAMRALALHPVLAAESRLSHARSAARAEVRGLPSAAAAEALEREPLEGELGFARALERSLLALRGGNPPPEAIDSIRKLYEAQERPERRRQVILDASQRAADLGAESVVEALAELYVDDLKPGSDERRRAERIYQRAILGRAYRELGARQLESARADFEAVGRKTGNLEAFMGAINVEARMDAPREAIVKRYANVEPKETRAFIEAYVVARDLSKLTGEAHRAAVADAIAKLRKGWKSLKTRAEARSLRGSLLHERFLIEGDAAAAQRANVHYLVALDLVRSNVRLKALVLGQMALLQAHVGNWRLALTALQEREKLPYPDNGAGLAVRLARARTLFHVGREAEAAEVAKSAVTMIDRKKRLAEYRPLAIDASALYHLAAGKPEASLALYDELLGLLGKDLSERNRVAVRLGHAAAALGTGAAPRALEDLAAVDAALAAKRLPEALRWPHSEDESTLRAYRIIAAGLRANAHLALGQLEPAERALERRRTLLLERLAAAPDVPESQHAVTLVETRLADNARARGDTAAAAAWVARAVQHADAALRGGEHPVDGDLLTALRLAAELRLEGAVLPFDLDARLRAAHQAVVRARDPAHAGHLRWLEAYLAVAKSPPVAVTRAAE